MNSGVKITFDVIKPGSQTEENQKGELISFSELSVSGRIINAYNALLLADFLSRKKITFQNVNESYYFIYFYNKLNPI